MLEEPGEDVVDVEDCAVWSADGGIEGLERDGAEVEREALEGCVGPRGFCQARACAGGEGIFGGPLTVGDLILRSVKGWVYPLQKFAYVEFVGS